MREQLSSLLVALAIGAALYGVFVPIVDGPLWLLLLVPAAALAVCAWALARGEEPPRSAIGEWRPRGR